MIKFLGNPTADFKSGLSAISGSRRIRTSTYEMYRACMEKTGRGDIMIPFGEMNYQKLYDKLNMGGGILVPENTERWSCTIWITVGGKPHVYTYTAEGWKTAIIKVLTDRMVAEYKRLCSEKESSFSNPTGA